jgi:hypothetical protein
MCENSVMSTIHTRKIVVLYTLMKQSEPNYKARPDSVLEISRRIKSGQRELFDFLNLFKKMNLKPDMITLASPPNVRVNLISRYDNIKPQGSEHIAGLAQRQISELLGLRQIATCDEYATITLGTAMLSDKGDGWTAVEMPIVSSDYSFSEQPRTKVRGFNASLSAAS